MDMAALKIEVNTDPESIGYGAMSDAQVAESLNAVTRPVLQPLTSADLLAWAAANGRLAKIQNLTLSEDLTVRSVASAAMLLIQRDGTTLDLSQPDRADMLQVLVAAGALDDDDAADLQARATTAVSRSSQLGLGRVYPYHVEQARA